MRAPSAWSQVHLSFPNDLRVHLRVAHRRADGIYAQPQANQTQQPQAVQPPVVAAAYVPPQIADPTAVASAPAKPDMGGGQPIGLSQALASASLSQYEDGLRGLGVAAPADVQDLEEADCVGIGMKPLEFKRLMRIAVV